MAEAHAAFEAGDAARLRATLENWERGPAVASGGGADRTHILSTIAAVEARLATVAGEISSCGKGALAELHEEAVAAESEGRFLQRWPTRRTAASSRRRTSCIGWCSRPKSMWLDSSVPARRRRGPATGRRWRPARATPCAGARRIARAWGRNEEGQLGLGDRDDRDPPRASAGQRLETR